MRRIWGKSEARREGEYIVYKVHELYNHYCLEKVLFGCASSLPVRFLMRQFRDGTILAAPDLGFPWQGGKRHRVQAGPVMRRFLDLYNYRRYSKGTFPFLCMCMYVYLLLVFIFLSLTDLLMDDLGKD